jgi:hypothetical protein
MNKVRVENYCRIEESGEYSTGQYRLIGINQLMRAEFIHEPTGIANWNKILGNTLNVLWLRRPIDRLVSQHAMISRWTDEECGGPGSPHWQLREVAHEGFLAFLRDPTLAAHRNRFNGVTGFLQLGDRSVATMWDSQRFHEHERSRRKAVEIALRNLQEMHFVGFVETFSQSFHALSKVIGWPEDGPPVSVNVHNTSSASLTAEELEAAQPSIELDEEIYAAAQKLVEDRQGNHPDHVKMATPRRFEQERIGPRESIIVHPGGNEFVSGWYSCERNGSKLSRWSGPAPISKIALHVEKGRDLFIRARISEARSIAQLNRLTCKVDGCDIALTTRLVGPHDVMIEGVIEGSKLNPSDKLLWITFDCGETEKAAAAGDARKLGLEFCEVEVGPNDNYAGSSLALLPFG